MQWLLIISVNQKPMKTYSSQWSIIMLLAFCFSNSFGHQTKMSMQQALEKKHISATALCKGGLELKFSIFNALKDSINISLPAGWRFNSNSSSLDYQDILITKEQFFVLRSHETKIFLIKGYCCEYTKSGPIEGVPYTNGKLADSNLVFLARYLNNNALDANTEQQSVWAISDKQPTANITHSNDSLASMLRNYVSTLKGEPLPWFTLLKQAYVSQTGMIYNTPVYFKAKVNYTVPKIVYSYCFIVDALGNKVSQINGRWLKPDENEYLANFNVKGFKKGNYKLVLESLEGTLFEKGFEI